MMKTKTDEILSGIRQLKNEWLETWAIHFCGNEILTIAKEHPELAHDIMIENGLALAFTPDKATILTFNGRYLAGFDVRFQHGHVTIKADYPKLPE